MAFWKSDRGATVAEYAVILAVLGMGMWGAGQVLQRATSVALSGTLDTVNSSGATSPGQVTPPGNTTAPPGNTTTPPGNTATDPGNTATDPDCHGNGRKKC